MIKFNRRVDVKIRTLDQELLVQGGVSLDGQELFDIEFDVEWRDANEPSEGTVKIYNLGEGSRLLCQDAVQVEIFTGYENETDSNLQSVFLGEPQVQYSLLTGGNWETEFRLTSALTLTQQARFSQSYPKGTPLYVVFQDLADALAIPMLIDEGVDGTRAITRGFALSGNVRSCLYEAAGNFGVSFLIMYNSLFVAPLNAPSLGGRPMATATAEAVVISHDTGLLDWPRVVWQSQKQDVLDANGKQKVDADGTKITKTLNYKSLELTTLLEPSLRVGSVVSVESKMSSLSVGADVTEMGGITNEIINGLYVCSTVRHAGTTAGEGEYATTITAVEYSSPVSGGLAAI